MVDYSLNKADELDAGWHELVVEWYAIQQAGPSIGATMAGRSSVKRSEARSIIQRLYS